MSRARMHALTPWGKAVIKQIIDRDLTQAQVVDAIRAQGIKITRASFSAMMSGRHGTRSPDMVAAVDRLLDIPPEVTGRPA